MTKPKSADELHTLTNEAFEFHKNANKLYVASDGQCFLEDSKNAAELHIRRAGLKLIPVTRDEFFKKGVSDVLLDALKGAVIDLQEGEKEGDAKEPDDKGSEEGKKEEEADQAKNKLSDLIADKTANKKHSNKR